MEGQSSDESAKPKARTKIACDVGCQTDAVPSTRYNVLPQPAWLNEEQTPSSGCSPDDDSPGGSCNKNPMVEQTTGGSSSQAGTTNGTSATAGVLPSSVASAIAQKTKSGALPNNLGNAKKPVRAQSVQNQQGSSTNSKSEPTWTDESGVLRLVIKSFSALNETMCSAPKSIKGVSWKIMVMPKQHMVQKKQQKCMGFFLQCAPEHAYSDQWSVHAVADMRMLSQKEGQPHFSRRTTHTYTSKENDWGYSCFMTWADIVDSDQGYIKNDVIILEIAVQSEPPKNMISHEAFVKKIENWMNLADFQFKKGSLDLAIEANLNAKNFCNGKDEACMERLNAQSASFDKAKINETIERLTKMKDPANAPPPETSAKQTSTLRQALSGAQKNFNGKITAKNGKKTRAVVTVQQMKKKKPYEQNNTAQQRFGNTNSSVKDLVEMKKNGKVDAKDKTNESSKVLNTTPVKSAVPMETTAVSAKQDNAEEKEQVDVVSEAGYDTDVIFKDFDQVGDDDYDEDDETYNEGDYADQAFDVDASGYNRQADPFGSENELTAPCDIDLVDGDYGCSPPWKASSDDLIKSTKAFLMEDSIPVFCGTNEEGKIVCDRTTQTLVGPSISVGEGNLAPTVTDEIDVDSAPHTENPPLEDTTDDSEMAEPEISGSNLDSETTTDEASATVPPIELYKQIFASGIGNIDSPESHTQFYNKLLESVKSGSIFDGLLVQTPKVFNFDLNERNCVNSLISPFNGMKIQDLPGFRLTCAEDPTDSSESIPFTLADVENLLKQWLNVEMALITELSPESVLARMTEPDRRELFDEINRKLSPLVLALDMVRCFFLEFRDNSVEAQQFLDNAKCVYLKAYDLIREFEKVRSNFDESICGEGENVVNNQLKETSPSKPVTSPAAANGSALKINSRGRPTATAKRSLKNESVPLTEADLMNLPIPLVDSDALKDIQWNFNNLNTAMVELNKYIIACGVRLRECVREVFGCDGIAKQIQDLQLNQDKQISRLTEDVDRLKKDTINLNNSKSKVEKELNESRLALQSEIEKHTKTQKELKDLKTQLKKTENRATKEENRASTLQVGMNQLEDKMKNVKKELESLRKKSNEERAKAKKEKDRDSQTIRQQSNEINNRENERDKIKKELEECRSTKDNIEKERRLLMNQVTSMTDRARAAESSLIESRMLRALDKLNARKSEIAASYQETEKNMNGSRQANDREVLRKSLAEWKCAMEKCEASIKSTTADHEAAMETVKKGGKTLAQIGEIKLPAQEALPKFVKPPPVQVVAPSSPIIPPPVIPPAPAAGVIGQPRTLARAANGSAESQNVSSCSTPSKSRVSRPLSPSSGTANKPSNRTTDETPSSSLWSWNTIGNLEDLRSSVSAETTFNSSLETFQNESWNSSVAASLGNDFMRAPTSTLSSLPFNYERQVSQPNPQRAAPPLHTQTSQNLNRQYAPNAQNNLWNQPSPMPFSMLSQSPSRQQQQQQQQQHHQQRQTPQQHQQQTESNMFNNSFGVGVNSQNTATWRSQHPPTGNQLHNQSSLANLHLFSHPFYE